MLNLFPGGQPGNALSCSHAYLSASPSSVYLLVKLINWFGTWLACAAGPQGIVSGVFIRWFWDPGVSVSWLEAHSGSAGGSRGGKPARDRVGTGSSPLRMSPALEGERDILRKLQSATLPCQVAALRSHVGGNTKRQT